MMAIAAATSQSQQLITVSYFRCLTSKENPSESNFLALRCHDTVSLVGEEVLCEQIHQGSPNEQTKGAASPSAQLHVRVVDHINSQSVKASHKNEAKGTGRIVRAIDSDTNTHAQGSGCTKR